MIRLVLALALTSLAFTTDSYAQSPIVTQATHDLYLRFLPEGILAKAEETRIVFYDRYSVPQCYQQDGGFVSVDYNMAGGNDRFGNANKEFPWRTGGMDQAVGKDFKFLVLPAGEAVTGRFESVPSSFTNETTRTMVGRYPVGTKVGEVLMMPVGGEDETFEVRVLQKVRNGDLFDAAGNWQGKVYRPVRNFAHLDRLVNYHPGYKGWLKKNLGKWDSVEALQNRHPVRVFDSGRVIRSRLPEMPEDLTRWVLRQPFVDVTDIPWHKSGDLAGYAPDGGIVPAGYQGAFITGQSCASCHSTVLQHSHFFESRDWYGRIRGTDGIFSLPMADPSCVSPNGYISEPTWSRQLINAGLLKVR